MVKGEGVLSWPSADCNCFAIGLGSLSSDVPFVTGDPIFCKGCNVVLSKISKVEKTGDGLVWRCEFCKTINEGIKADELELPKEDVVDFVLAPPPSSNVETHDNLVVYCVDASGSMCVTTEVPALLEEWKKLREGGGGKSKDKSFISRIDCVKSAVQTMLDRTHLQHPNKRVILVTFNSEVTVFGDGSQEPQVITGDKLNDYDAMVASGVKGLKYEQLKALSESVKEIKEKIQNLQEEGSTALGPALLLSAAIASQKPRSEVVICTDGIPNVGLGSLETDNEDELIAAREFYTRVGIYAKSNNTSISVIGIEGTDGALSSLSSCAEITSGAVNILHPLELVRQIRQLTQNPVVATNVELSTILHPDLAMSRYDSPQGLSRVVKEIANVNSDNDITFEYSLRARAKDAKAATYPFQTQIKYTKLNGMRCLRVISYVKQTTKQRSDLEPRGDVAVAGLSAIQHAAMMAQESEYASARLKLRATQRFFQKFKSDVQQEEYANFLTQSELLDDELRKCLENKAAAKKSDAAAKIFFQMKSATRVLLLAGMRKDVGKRKGDAALNQQYYSIKF